MKLHATGTDLIITENERLISGSVNIHKCEFTFDSVWDGYMITAVFSTGNRTVNMAIVDGVCDIPVEVLRPNAKFHVGIVGVSGDITRPTIYSDWVCVEQGANVNASAGKVPEQSVFEEWMDALNKKHEEWEANEQARQEAEEERESHYADYVEQVKTHRETVEKTVQELVEAQGRTGRLSLISLHGWDGGTLAVMTENDYVGNWGIEFDALGRPVKFTSGDDNFETVVEW